MTTRPPRVFLLARVSTTKGSQAESPDGQLDAMVDYFTRQGPWVEVGRDVAKESGGTLEREGLRQAMAMVRAGKVDVLACSDLDRFGRNVKEMLEHADEISRLGARLIFARMADQSMVDTTTTNGRMMFTFFAGIAEWYRNHYRGKSIEGQQRAKAKGKHVGRAEEKLPPAAALAAWKARNFTPGITWRRLSEDLARQGHLQPARFLKNRGIMRPARSWPPGTLQVLMGRWEAAAAHIGRLMAVLKGE